MRLSVALFLNLSLRDLSHNRLSRNFLSMGMDVIELDLYVVFLAILLLPLSISSAITDVFDSDMSHNFLQGTLQFTVTSRAENIRLFDDVHLSAHSVRNFGHNNFTDIGPIRVVKPLGQFYLYEHSPYFPFISRDLSYNNISGALPIIGNENATDFEEVTMFVTSRDPIKLTESRTTIDLLRYRVNILTLNGAQFCTIR